MSLLFSGVQLPVSLLTHDRNLSPTTTTTTTTTTINNNNNTNNTNTAVTKGQSLSCYDLQRIRDTLS